MARPLKLELEERSLIRMALLPAAPFHPESIPSSLTKRKFAATPFESLKPFPPAKTIPVGVPPIESPGVGILTGGLAITPSEVYTSLTCQPLEFTQGTPEGAQASPQAFCNVGSTWTGLYSILL